jgi:hypothetical protein
VNNVTYFSYIYIMLWVIMFGVGGLFGVVYCVVGCVMFV